MRIAAKQDFFYAWRIYLNEVGKMLIDTSITIAYKCTSCGSFEFFNVSMFTLTYKKNCGLSCRCRKSCISMEQEGGNGYLVNIPCIGCGNEHTYLITKKSMLLGETTVLNCPETGMQICFIGRDEAVRRKVDSLEEEFDELMDTYGYENYFRNTQVMFDTLNHIHDIALKGNLSCECGDSDIELVLLSDCILLRCGRCGGNRIIPAAKNEDLGEVLKKSQLFITRDDLVYEDSLISRRSGDKFGK
jgi:hypothetical protein